MRALVDADFLVALAKEDDSNHFYYSIYCF